MPYARTKVGQRGRVDSKTLTKRQLDAIPVIINSKTVTEACGKLGVQIKIYYEWMQKDAFAEELRRQRDLRARAITDMRLGQYEPAVEHLGKLMREAEDERVQFKATEKVIDDAERFMGIRDKDGGGGGIQINNFMTWVLYGDVKGRDDGKGIEADVKEINEPAD